MKFNKNKLQIILIVVGLVAVVCIGYLLFVSIIAMKDTTPKSAIDYKNNATSMEIQDGSKYATLKGDAFDEAFVADMLAHHEGAVNMAEQAQAVTARAEIKKFAGDITTAQSMEMVDMRGWQKAWGYATTMSGGHMSHSGAGMQMGGDMVEMMNKLKDLTGDAYDKEFLKQMIIHHEQAVAMSQYAETNAKHIEVKQLARAIISSQSAEVQQMKQWQKDWAMNSKGESL